MVSPQRRDAGFQDKSAAEEIDSWLMYCQYWFSTICTTTSSFSIMLDLLKYFVSKAYNQTLLFVLVPQNHGSCGSANWNQVYYLQWINNWLNLYPYLLHLVMCLQKCHSVCFLRGFSTIHWKSETDVQTSLFSSLSLATWIFVWMLFPHPNLWMLKAFLLWILMFVSCEDSQWWSPTIISLGAFSVNFL